MQGFDHFDATKCHLNFRETEGDEKDDDCAVCGKRGYLISCEKCPLSFHLSCCVPPLTKSPKRRWECHMCKPSKTAPIKLKGLNLTILIY